MSAALIQDLFNRLPRPVLPSHSIPGGGGGPTPGGFLRPRTPNRTKPLPAPRGTHASGGSRFLPLSVVPYHTGVIRPPRPIVREKSGVSYSTDDSPVGGAAGDAGDQPATGDVPNAGSTPTTPGDVVSAATSSDSTSQDNSASPDTTYTPATPSGGGGAPITPTPSIPSTSITTGSSNSHLLWWILGGVAAVGVIWIAWRMFGHKGAAAATSSAAKAAAYYGMR